MPFCAQFLNGADVAPYYEGRETACGFLLEKNASRPSYFVVIIEERICGNLNGRCLGLSSSTRPNRPDLPPRMEPMFKVKAGVETVPKCIRRLCLVDYARLTGLALTLHQRRAIRKSVNNSSRRADDETRQEWTVSEKGDDSQQVIRLMARSGRPGNS
jgi:hypothetical protein